MLGKVRAYLCPASLLLNAMLVGFIVSLCLPGRPLNAVIALTGSTRVVLEEMLAPELPSLERAMATLEGGKAKIETLLNAEKIDSEAFEAALAEMHNADAAAFGSLERALRGASQRDVSERRAIAQALHRLQPPGPPGMKGLGG